MSAFGGPNGIPMSEHLGQGYTGMMPIERLPLTLAFHEVDTVPPRIPDRLYNPVRSWCDTPPISLNLPYVPPIDLDRVFRREGPRVDPDPWHTPLGVIAAKPLHSWEIPDPDYRAVGLMEAQRAARLLEFDLFAKLAKFRK